MYELEIQLVLLLMLYAGVAVMSMNACCYLLLRRGNAFAPDITPPVRLRRWTAAFFASVALGHLWYLPTYFLSSSDDIMLCNLVGGLLDSMTVFPLVIVILFSMLQDRRRPLWPVALMVAPLIAGMTWGVISRSDAFMPVIRIYFLLLSIGLIAYMVREVRRYGRWLRDNYADLEHKEVSQSFVVLAVILFVSVFYVGGFGWSAYEYVVQACDVVLICYLLWRVETLSDLSLPQPLSLPVTEPASTETEAVLSQTTYDYIEALLQQHCTDKQFYLQHDLNLTQLAKAIGTNRTYLTNYFTSHGITYNAYINDLRINHFVSLYREAIASQRPFTAQQLAHDSGYQSYSTFSLAFKHRMGQSATAWMHAATLPLVLAIVVCGAMASLTSCSNDDDQTEEKYEYTGVPLVILDTDIGYKALPTHTDSNGKLMFQRSVADYSSLPDGWQLYRKAWKLHPLRQYRQLLAAQPDHSVSIVSIGFVTCLAQLLQSEPDSYSSLNGVELVRRPGVLQHTAGRRGYHHVAWRGGRWH